jgi:hypothetical protein
MLVLSCINAVKHVLAWNWVKCELGLGYFVIET